MPHEILQTARGNIPYTLFPQFSRSYSPEGNSEIVQHASVAWDRVFEFVKAMVADCEVGEAFSNVDLSDFAGDTPVVPVAYPIWYKLKRKLPEPHPILTDHYAHKIEIIEGIGYITTNNTVPEFRVNPMSSQTEYGRARVAITYRWLPYTANLSDDDIYVNNGANLVTELRRYVSVKVKGSGSNLPLPPGNGFTWVINGTGSGLDGTSSGQPITEPIAIPITKASIILTWHMVPQVPAAAFELMGKVNHSTITNYFWNLFPNAFRPGLLRYDEPEISPPYPTISGQRVVDVSYHFVYKKNGHNHFFRPAAGEFQRLYKFPTPPIQIAQGALPAPAPGNVFNFAELNHLFRLA